MTDTPTFGPGLTGAEMRALKGIVPDDTPVRREDWHPEKYGDAFWQYYEDRRVYHLPSDSPVYTVRDWNAKHPDDRPFIPHCGDTCPVDGDVLVDVLLVEGSICERERASTLTWAADGAGWDIIAYRLAEPATESGEAPTDTVTLPRMTEAEAAQWVLVNVRAAIRFHDALEILQGLGLIKTPAPTPIEQFKQAHPEYADGDDALIAAAIEYGRKS